MAISYKNRLPKLCCSLSTTRQNVLEAGTGHTYYYQKVGKGPDERERVTAEWMRVSMGRVMRARTIPDAFIKQDGEDFVDILFRLGSSMITPEYKKQCGYDRKNFPETALPRYEEEEQEDEEEEEEGEGEEAEISLTGNSSRENITASNVAAKEDATEELMSASGGMKLHYNESDSQPDSQNEDSVQVAPRLRSRGKRRLGAAEITPVTITGHTRASHDMSGSDIRRPTPEEFTSPAQQTESPIVAVAGQKMPQLSPANVELITDTGESRKKLRIKGPRDTSPLETIQVDGTRPRSSAVMEPTAVRTAHNVPTMLAESPPTGNSSDSPRERQQAQASVNYEDHHQEESERERQQAQRLVNHRVHPQEEDSGLKRQEAQSPVDYELHHLEQELETVKNDLHKLTIRLLRAVGRADTGPCTLDPNPSDQAINLFKRCWGSEWQEVRYRLTTACVFTATEVTMALFSGFLHDHVLDQHPSVQKIQEKLSEIPGTTRKVFLKLLQGEGKVYFDQSVLDTDTEEARERLAQDKDLLDAQLKLEAKTHAAQLWPIVLPHLRELRIHLRGLGRASEESKQVWHDIFEPAMTAIIVKALFHRLRLHERGCKYVYTWPSNNESYEPHSMQIEGGLAAPIPGVAFPKERVLFAVFPGLKVEVDGSDGLPKWDFAFTAAVKIQQG